MALKSVQIKKVQVKPRSVTVEFTHEQKKIVIKGKYVIPATPSKEFVAKLQKLVPFAMKTSALGYFEHALDADALSKHISTEDLKDVKKITLNYVVKSLSLSSLTFKYDESGICGLIMIGSHANHNGNVSETKSPIIDLRGNVYGFEKKVGAFCELFTEEVIEFVNGNYTDLPLEEPEEEEVVEAPETGEDEVEEEEVEDPLSLDAPTRKTRVMKVA